MNKTYQEILDENKGNTINDIARECYKTALDKGWYVTPREDGTIMMLMVSEIAEAMECMRNGEEASYTKDGKPEGTAIELADCVIRIMDYFQHKGWDLEKAIKDKMEYNKTRPFRHGGKAF